MTYPDLICPAKFTAHIVGVHTHKVVGVVVLKWPNVVESCKKREKIKCIFKYLKKIDILLSFGKSGEHYS